MGIGDAVYNFTMMFLQMWSATESKKMNEIQFPDMIELFVIFNHIKLQKTLFIFVYK